MRFGCAGKPILSKLPSACRAWEDSAPLQERDRPVGAGHTAEPGITASLSQGL